MLDNPNAVKLLKQMRKAGDKGLTIDDLSIDDKYRAHQLVAEGFAEYADYQISTTSLDWIDGETIQIPVTAASLIKITVSGKDALAARRYRKSMSAKDRLFQILLLVIGWLLNSLYQFLSELLSRSVPPVH